MLFLSARCLRVGPRSRRTPARSLPTTTHKTAAARNPDYAPTSPSGLAITTTYPSGSRIHISLSFGAGLTCGSSMTSELVLFRGQGLSPDRRLLKQLDRGESLSYADLFRSSMAASRSSISGIRIHPPSASPRSFPSSFFSITYSTT